jgi:ribonuclease HI
MKRKETTQNTRIIETNKDANGRIVKWAMELCPYTLGFRSRSTIKSQALVDFIVEWTDMNTPASPTSVEHWTMYFDSSLNIDGAGAGVYFISPSGDKLSYVLRIHFRASNNAAEYEAAVHGLRIAIELGIKRLMVYGDSALVIRQVNKDWDCNNEKMDAYVATIRKLENKFYGLEFHHVLRANNQAADVLSKLGSTRVEIPHGVFVEDLLKPSIKEEDKPEIAKPPADQSIASISVQDNDGREPFIRYLTSADVPRDKVKTERLIRRSKQYVLVDGTLMRKNASGELL